jgi:site-specific recombinase XerC
VYLTVRDRAMREVLYSAAVRVSELVGLNWQDIDWGAREIRVLGKGNKERVCPLGQKALDALLDYARHYEEYQKQDVSKKWSRGRVTPDLFAVKVSFWTLKRSTITLSPLTFY